MGVCRVSTQCFTTDTYGSITTVYLHFQLIGDAVYSKKVQGEITALHL